MYSLLVLSLALSTPASAAQAPVVPTSPLVASSQPDVNIQMGEPLIVEEQLVHPFDDMEIHPDSDTCYRIRLFLFSKGQHPKFLREMTCGPKVPSAKKTDGTKPGFMPLELKAKPTQEGEQDIPVP